MLSILEETAVEQPRRRGTLLDKRSEPDVDLIEPPVEELSPSETPADYEIVMGRAQIASVLFIAVVLMVVFSGISYLAGKSVAPAAAPVPIPTRPEPAVETAAPVALAAPVATIVAPEPPKPKPVPERPLFADPKNGVVYMQLGAVEKGIAIIMTEGFRKRGFDAFIAPGPNDHIFRVLIGPLDNTAYQKTKEAVDELGLAAFVRKYQQ